MRSPALAVLAVLICGHPSVRAQSPTYTFLRSDDPVQDRVAYLLTLMNYESGVRKALAAESNLIGIGQRLAGTRAAIIAACTAPAVTSSPECPIDQLELTDAEILKAGNILRRLASTGGPLNRMLQDHMRLSGRFQKYARLDDEAFMRAAWEETARGVNRLYRVYGLGEPFSLSSIDGMTRSPKDDQYRSLLASVLKISTDSATSDPFFAIWACVGFDLLAINQRDEAARYEPLETGENAAAFANAHTFDWRSVRYSAIVVPGIGLEAGETGISPLGALRVRMAVKRWREGLASFIIVSGGHVHPNRTPYAEAIEMKHALMTRYGMPANAILVDPYARHTTTNLRNATRLLFRMGAPMDKPVIIMKLDGLSEYILSKDFGLRCEKELGYEPMSNITDLAEFEMSAKPNIVSLHADPKDPLDP
jgi:hypothetical protein